MSASCIDIDILLARKIHASNSVHCSKMTKMSHWTTWLC